MILHIRNLILAGVAGMLCAAEPDVFRITAQPVVHAPQRFGINVDPPQMEPWYVDRMTNQWNLMSACEPLAYQYSGICDGGGADFLQHRDGSGLSWWDCARSGYWDGATVRIYRMRDGVFALLRQETVARSLCGLDAAGKRTEDRLYFARPGAEVAPGDLYVLDMQRDAPARPFRPALLNTRGGDVMYDSVVDTIGGARWTLDRANPCPEGGSTASLKVTLPAGDGKVEPGMWQWWVVQSDHDLAFNAGKRYRGQIWLRQEGVPGGTVHLQLGTLGDVALTATGAWQRFEFPIPVEHPAKPYLTAQGEASRLMVTAPGGGTLWIDNFLVWQEDVAPFAFMPDYVQALKDYRPSVLRLWSGHVAPTARLALQDGFTRWSTGRYAGVGAPSTLSIPGGLRLCAEVGADPWLILNPLWSEADHRLFMEFLAGPADSEGGRLRVAQGRAAPWTEAFAIIRLESGNECWNMIFSPKAWPGQPAFYAAIADRQFRELQASPFWRADRFETVLSGWDGQMAADGWTGQTANASRLGQCIDVASYFGGWEKGADGDGDAGAVFQDRLFATEIEYGRKWLTAQTIDPDLTRRLAGAFVADPGLRTQCLTLLEPRNRWTDAQLRSGDGDVRARLAALRAADTQVVRDLQGSAGGLRQALDDPAWGAAYLALMRDPALGARTRSELGIDAAAAESLGRLMCVLNNLGMIARLGKERPEVMDALAASAAFAPDEKVRAQLLAARQGAEPGWDVHNALKTYARRRVQEALAADAGAFGSALLAQYDAQRVRESAQGVRWVFTDRLRELPRRRSDQLMAAMRRDATLSGLVFASLAKDPALMRDQAGDLAVGLASSIAGLASPPAPDQHAFALLPNLPSEVRRRVLDQLLPVLGDASGGMAPTEIQVLKACGSALLGDAAPAQALATDQAVLAMMAGQIMGGVNAAIMRQAGEDASLGGALLAALAAQPGGGKRLAIYEGGPGYSLPGPGKAPPEDDENIGKSLVGGTATLDAYLLATLNGAGPNCYYTFQSGRYWAFQSNPHDRVPYPSWLALGMRNRLCSGDLLRVEPVQVATRDVPDRTVVRTTNDGKGQTSQVKGRRAIPLVACYAFGDGKRISVVLINRDADQARTVALQLPGTAAGPATTRVLSAASPRDHNRNQAMVRESDGPQVDLAQRGQVVLPPAAVVVLVVGLR